MSDNTNQNVEVVSSLVDEILEGMYNIEASASYIKGDFGNAINEKIKAYSSAASDLANFTTNSFRPASELIVEYKQGINKERISENKINMEVEAMKKSVYNQVYEKTKSDATAREASEKAAMQFRQQRMKEIEELSRHNDELRLKIENYGEENLMSSPTVLPYRYDIIGDEEGEEVVPSGINIDDINVQTKYGVAPPPPNPSDINYPNGVQTKYGVAPPPPATTTEVITITIPPHPGVDVETTQHITVTHPVQTKYGIPPRTIVPNVQTKYGVVCPTEPTKIPDNVQTKYGVAPPPPQTTTITVTVPDGHGGNQTIHPVITIPQGTQTRYGVVGPCGLPFNVQTRYGIKECK